MADGSIRVPLTGPLSSGTETDCDTIVRSGVTYFRQRVVVVGSELPVGAATAALQQNNALTNTELRAVALPLPVGAATAALQQNNALTNTELRAVALPLPVGASTEVTAAALLALQATGIGAEAGFDTVSLLNNILKELRMMNMHIASMTGEKFTMIDIGD